MEDHLKKLQNLEIPKINEEITILSPISVIKHQVPDEKSIELQEVEWGANLAFSNLPFEDFIFLFFALLLEYKIVFISSNIKLLTSTMFKLKKIY